MNKFINAYNNMLTKTIITHIKQQLLIYNTKPQNGFTKCQEEA